MNTIMTILLIYSILSWFTGIVYLIAGWITSSKGITVEMLFAVILAPVVILLLPMVLAKNGSLLSRILNYEVLKGRHKEDDSMDTDDEDEEDEDDEKFEAMLKEMLAAKNREEGISVKIPNPDNTNHNR